MTDLDRDLRRINAWIREGKTQLALQHDAHVLAFHFEQLETAMREITMRPASFSAFGLVGLI